MAKASTRTELARAAGGAADESRKATASHAARSFLIAETPFGLPCGSWPASAPPGGPASGAVEPDRERGARLELPGDGAEGPALGDVLVGLVRGDQHVERRVRSRQVGEPSRRVDERAVGPVVDGPRAAGRYPL